MNLGHIYVHKKQIIHIQWRPLELMRFIGKFHQLDALIKTLKNHIGKKAVKKKKSKLLFCLN